MPSEASDALTVCFSERPFVVTRSLSAKHLFGEDVLGVLHCSAQVYSGLNGLELIIY